MSIVLPSYFRTLFYVLSSLEDDTDSFENKLKAKPITPKQSKPPKPTKLLTNLSRSGSPLLS